MYLRTNDSYEGPASSDAGTRRRRPSRSCCRIAVGSNVSCTTIATRTISSSHFSQIVLHTAAGKMPASISIP